MNTISFLEKLQPVRKRNTQVVIGECGRYHKIGFPGMLGKMGDEFWDREFGEALSSYVVSTKSIFSFKAAGLVLPGYP